MLKPRVDQHTCCYLQGKQISKGQAFLPSSEFPPIFLTMFPSPFFHLISYHSPLCSGHCGHGALQWFSAKVFLAINYAEFFSAWAFVHAAPSPWCAFDVACSFIICHCLGCNEGRDFVASCILTPGTMPAVSKMINKY